MKPTKKQVEYAQDDLMQAMRLAFANVTPGSEEFLALEAQFRRIEKFLGYDAGSWSLGV